MDILVPSVPARLKITQTLIEDVICNPVIGARHIMNLNLDVFQRVRLKICWNTPRVMDTSGFSSAKSFNMWIVSNLRALLFREHAVAVYYPKFENTKQIYYIYYNKVASRAPIFRAQLGRLTEEGIDSQTGGVTKASNKGTSCWVMNYLNGSKVMMPAPGFSLGARTSAGYRFNDLNIDEWTKVEQMSKELDGIDDQLIGRTTKGSWNQLHPILGNHHLFLATAEDDVMHPAHERYESYMDEVRAGNPDYFVFGFCFKDHSNLKFENDTFSGILRNEAALKDMKKNKTKEGYLAEGIGVWGRNKKGLYTSEMIKHCHEVGVRDNARIICSRREDPQGDKAKYFLGIDPAKADNKKADDGALVSLRALPLTDELTNDVSNYKLSWNYAYRVRRADAGQWGGIIHQKHQQFGFSGMMLDPGGGGIWNRPELAKSHQMIRGARTSVRPLACVEDEQEMLVAGEFILSIFKPKDVTIVRAYGDMDMKQQDNLTDLAHEEMCEGLARGIGFPPPPKRGTDERYTTEEQVMAARLVEMIGTELLAIFYKTESDGMTHHNKHGAREFSSKRRKDFAYAALMAYLRFLMWVKSGSDDLKVGDDDMDMIGASD
jgi:hypothetical protein